MAKPVLGIVSTWFERGATRVSLAYIAVLKEQFSIRVYARGGDEFPHDDPAWNHDFVHWGEFVPGARSTFIDFSDFKKWIHREQVDYLFFNEQQSWDVIVKVKQQFTIPIGAYIDYYTDDSVKCFDLYDFVVCNTKRHHSVFEHHKNAIYIPWGVQSFAQRPPVNHNELTFFHNLGFNPQRKGTDLVIQAFQELKAPHTRLILHAQKPSSDFPQLEILIAGSEAIEWIDKEVPPPGLYHKGDVYVYPSRLEGIGLSLPEALSEGLPVITTDEAPMNEFVFNGENGRLATVQRQWKREDGYYWNMSEVDVASLTSAMRYYVEQQDQLSAFKSKTLDLAKTKLNWNENAKGLSKRILEITWNTPSDELLKYVQEMEQKETPKVSAGQQLHRILISLGFRKIKRTLLGRS